jgi:hypothetical protein
VRPAPEGSGEAERSPRGVGRAGDLLCWAGLGRSYTHDYFRRAKTDVFGLLSYGYRTIGTRQFSLQTCVITQARSLRDTNYLLQLHEKEIFAEFICIQSKHASSMLKALRKISDGTRTINKIA